MDLGAEAVPKSHFVDLVFETEGERHARSHAEQREDVAGGRQQGGSEVIGGLLGVGVQWLCTREQIYPVGFGRIYFFGRELPSAQSRIRQKESDMRVLLG